VVRALAAAFFSLAALVALTPLGGGAAHAQDASASSDHVIASFVAALDNHDLTRATLLIALDAHVLAPFPINGREAIARWLAFQYPDDATLEVSSPAVNGQRVTWTSQMTSGAYPQRRWEESVVVDGQIAYWSSRVLGDEMVMPPIQRARTLDPSVPSSLSAISALGSAPWWPCGIAAAGLLAGGVFGLRRVRSHHRIERQSRQGGRLLLNLRNRPRS
jgi:hypothetical protein